MSISLQTRRHSAAHVMAAAIQELFPGAKFGVGPAIDNGFYYDIDIGRALTPDDLKEIQKATQKLANKKIQFERREMDIDEAIKLFEQLGQPYKVELLHAIKTKGTTKLSAEEAADLNTEAPERVSVYVTGDFTDLCRGPHVDDSSQIGAFKVSRMAAVYWRGDDHNPQLQRVYGLCFATQEELDAYEKMLEEAKKRDHKILGPALDLFTFSELVGSGLPLWTPKGTILRNLLDDFVWSLRSMRGYEKVEIPHITKKELYEVSGHWEKYQNDLFKIKTREGHEFAMKPMNCPHHTQIYARKLWSYRDLPQRYANTTMCYRDEQTGELSGLSRARSFTQDDAHVFCRMSQAKAEFLKIWDIVHEFYAVFGFELQVRLSRHNPAEPQKYLGDPAKWDKAESMLQEIINEKGVTAIDGMGEAAFYGPKLDFIAKDSLGREWQVATIQLDLNMPERFGLVCVNENGEQETIVMIHAAIMGSVERFLAIAIEHYAGAFPLWLSPVQIKILPVADRHNEFADKLAQELEDKKFRVEVDHDAESVGKKIRNAEQAKIPVMLVVGDKEAEGGELTVRRYGQKEQKTIGKKELIEILDKEIHTKK